MGVPIGYPLQKPEEASKTARMTSVQGVNLKLRNMDEKNMHNLFLKNMAGLIEEVKNPSPCLNPNSKRGGMATHAGVALELGITRPSHNGGLKTMSPQMEAILIWCQCRVREYKGVKIELHRVVEERCGLLRSHSQLFPSVIRLLKNQPREPETKLRDCF